MAVIVKDILEGSIFAGSFVRAGYAIESIDSAPVKDILDLMFYTQKEEFQVNYRDNSHTLHSQTLSNNFDRPLGVQADLPTCRQCCNNCIFCFIDQMPPYMRESLYVKDDDFIHSFFYGNFISLTNLSHNDINKIIDQHISPLYVSIHTTNHSLHKKLFRYKNDFNILQILKQLTDADIEIHAQIVLIPEVNDQAELFKTLTHLVEIEQVTTIGIVPVGLTKHRNNLYHLRKVTQTEATQLITQVEFMKNSRQLSHIYLADEFFILARLPMPQDHYYDNYDQIENGIGMVRKAWHNWRYLKRKYLSFLSSLEGNPTFITSMSGIQAIDPILKDIQKSLPNKKVRAIVIKNNFFGDEVTVCGLLTWKDISQQLRLADDEYPVFSSAIFNNDLRTLDDIHLEQIENMLSRKVVITSELFSKINIKDL